MPCDVYADLQVQFDSVTREYDILSHPQNAHLRTGFSKSHQKSRSKELLAERTRLMNEMSRHRQTCEICRGEKIGG
jgi:hypothetical protein